MSESNLAAALLAVQKAMPPIHKDSKATVPTKKGGVFTYTYLSLAALLDHVLPVLNEHGLALSQMPTYGPHGGQALETTLYHESGEKYVGETPLVLGEEITPQAQGSAITYARRYALTALLGIAADEDDDGAAASRPARKPAAQNSAKSEETGSDGKASAAQNAMIHAIVGELALARDKDPEIVRQALKDKIGIPSMKGLSRENASRALDVLGEWQKQAQVPVA